ncbi:hypothetical protein FD733_06820 [Pantoea sp. Eser]|nr:hypothetical protein [Pantoea sp. Eser]
MESVNNVSDIINGHDLVICVADKPRNDMVKWLNEACCSTRVPYINGGLDILKAVFYSVIPEETGCTERWKSSLTEEKRKIIDEDNSIQNDYVTSAPALSALVSVTTGAMICEALKLPTDIQPPSLTNNLKTFSFDDLSITTTEQWALNPECVCCGWNKSKMNKLILSYTNTSFGFWLISFLVPLMVLDISGSVFIVSLIRAEYTSLYPDNSVRRCYL